MSEEDIIIFNNVEPHGWTLLEDDMHLLVMVFLRNLWLRS